MNRPEDLLSDIFQHAIEAVDPYRAVARHRDRLISIYEKGHYRRLFVLAFGKAVSPMLRAITDTMGEVVTGGIAITKHRYPVEPGKARTVSIYEAGHPLPDEFGLRATMGAVGAMRTFDDATLLVCLISGGGSALLVAPYPGISLKEKQETTDLLLRAGADIHELNAVRKHASMVKGGRLAEIAFPATIESLILSDVIGDRLDVIASGPTAPDSTTYADAMAVIEKFGLTGKIPRTLSRLLAEGAKGRIPETPKLGNPAFQRVGNTIIGSNKGAVEAARLRALQLGLDVTVLGAEVRGEARDVGRWLAGKAARAGAMRDGPSGAGKAVCLISGGETTVTVKGRGLGGRNMELALAFALEVEGREGVTLLSAGTDGTDGPTDAAGAIVDGHIVERARPAGIDAREYLARNDSYTFFARTGGLFITGPTNTNVMDLQIILVM
ncbi:MAG: glycerate kinase [Syntrophorhabdales bacterium]